MIKNIIYLISALLAVPLIIVTAVWYYNNKGKQFENTPLQTPMEVVQNDWGTPDRIFENGDVVYCFYKADVLNWGQYIFIFRKGKLSGKATDD